MYKPHQATQLCHKKVVRRGSDILETIAREARYHVSGTLALHRIQISVVDIDQDSTNFQSDRSPAELTHGVVTVMKMSVDHVLSKCLA